MASSIIATAPCPCISTGCEDGPGAWHDSRTTYQQRVRCVFGRTDSANPLGEGDPHRARQSVGAQDSGCGALPGRSPAGSFSLHPHLFLLVEPSGGVVRQNSTGCDSARCLYFCCGLGKQTTPLYPCLFQICQALSLDLYRSIPSHPC